MQFVQIGPNLFVREAARLQFHHRPVELSAGLSPQKILRQVPSGRDGQLGRDLLPDAALLEEFELPFHLPADFGMQLGLVRESANPLQEIARQLGQLASLDR